MGLFSRLFGSKQNKVRKRTNQPDVIDVQSEDEKMNWAMEKARLTLHHFKSSLLDPST